MKGKFISLEGGEGSGKSTALEHMETWLTAQNIPFLITREPGGTPLAEEIRELVLTKRAEPVAEMTELLLVFAARAQHLTQTIIPALEKGQWVISDRFIDSTYVYQGGGRGIDTSLLDTLTHHIVTDFLPDATFLLDVPVSVGQQRVAQRNQSDRLDDESVAFHETVRQGFLTLAKQSEERFKIIDATQSIDEVKGAISKELALLRHVWDER
ncbi:dTMP kinase [Marinomonas epiphytica]